VSADGVRQDLVVAEAPGGAGPLRVDLAVNGAQAEAAANGVRLVLDSSGRKLAYSRLRVVDAMGRELGARLEVVSNDRLAVLVDDTAATYPVRIDPTFSDADWVSLGGLPGASGEVYAAVADSSGNLYVGGNFSIVGDAFANFVAKWDGSHWKGLGLGLNGSVLALAMSGSNVYVGGEFTTAGGSPANNIAKWNGSSWSALGSGVIGRVSALVVSGTDLYAGGRFGITGVSAVNNIAKWNGSSWSGLGSGMGSTDWILPDVMALAVSGGDLYAGGLFTTAGGIPANRIAKWNGGGWSALGSGMDGYVFALAASGTNLYAGGNFVTAGGVSANYIAKWNGSAWSALGSGVEAGAVYPSVRALAVSGSDLYVGGDFTVAGGSSANRIAKWNGTSWSALGSGVDCYSDVMDNSIVLALAVSGSNVYAGGKFMTAGGIVANYIAKWGGANWSALGFGIAHSDVRALAVSGSNVYAGGDFSSAGGRNVTNIAKWDGSSWSPLGEGLDWAVSALAVSGNDVYAGGLFTTAGGSAGNYIAKWNGSSWSPLGTGMDRPVWALAVSGSDVYAGGVFTTAGGIAANYIAKWNGTSWTALGSGLGQPVLALAVSGSDVYAGGQFTTAGGTEAKNIAKWNGSAWSALGSGMNNSVSAMAVSGSDLYAGGSFTTAGGTPAEYVAKWDGTSWTALGSGLNDQVLALAVSGNELYFGGQFSTAGDKVSSCVAKVMLSMPPAGGFAGTIAVSNNIPMIVFQGTPGSPYDVQRTPSLSPPVVWTTLTSSSPLIPGADGLFSFTDTNAPSGTAYYRSGPR